MRSQDPAQAPPPIYLHLPGRKMTGLGTRRHGVESQSDPACLTAFDDDGDVDVDLKDFAEFQKAFERTR